MGKTYKTSGKLKFINDHFIVVSAPTIDPSKLKPKRNTPSEKAYRLFVYPKEGASQTVDVKAKDLNGARIKAKRYLDRPRILNIVINNGYLGRNDWIPFGYLQYEDVNGIKQLTWLGDTDSNVGSDSYIVDPKTGELLKRINSYDVRVTNSKMNNARVVIRATNLSELRKVLDRKFPSSSFKVFRIDSNGLRDVKLPSGKGGR